VKYISLWKVNKLARNLAKRFLLLPRQFNAGKRALPDYLVIGAQKAGTTSLFSSINQHPQVLPPLHKEIHYFDLRFEKGVSWYRSHFPEIARLKAAGAITGESSPYYLFHPHCAGRIHDLAPHAKIIILLRNPVDRAISHYFHERKHDAEPLSMDDAFRSEDGRIGGELKRMLREPLYRSGSHQHYSYLSRGIYADQLKPYLDLFPANQVLILKAEDLFARPVEIVREVYRFLGLSDAFVPRDLKARNTGVYPRNVDKGIYEYLADYFRSHNDRLYRLLGRNFGW
jgi:hypothetical protein